MPSNLQILASVDALVDKAEAFCTERGRAATGLIDARLASDMLPFGYQVKPCAAHSIGGIEGVRAGSFSPDRTAWPTDFAGLHAVLQAGYCQSNANRSPHDASGSLKATALARKHLSLRQCGGASFPVRLSIDEMAFEAEVVVDVGMDRGKLL